MYSAVKDQLTSELDEIRAAGLYKAERVIGTPQSANVRWAATRSSTSAPTTTSGSPTIPR